ncbi:MAG: hypothetical protein AAF329_23110, partial [Cyanobacteria bacterium P01_A01_bin.17]
NAIAILGCRSPKEPMVVKTIRLMDLSLSQQYLSECDCLILDLCRSTNKIRVLLDFSPVVREREK